jgi:hypothetical protein
MRKILIVSLIVVLTACGPVDSPNEPTNSLTPGALADYTPRPGDAALQLDAATVLSTDIRIMESYPLQFSVLLTGTLPTACHALRVLIHDPDAQDRIRLDVYSVVDPEALCAPIVREFEQSVFLGSYPAGRYTVWIGEEPVGEFDA